MEFHWQALRQESHVEEHEDSAIVGIGLAGGGGGAVANSPGGNFGRRTELGGTMIQPLNHLEEGVVGAGLAEGVPVLDGVRPQKNHRKCPMIVVEVNGYEDSLRAGIGAEDQLNIELVGGPSRAEATEFIHKEG
jgi:hypothetical protein